MVIQLCVSPSPAITLYILTCNVYRCTAINFTLYAITYAQHLIRQWQTLSILAVRVMPRIIPVGEISLLLSLVMLSAIQGHKNSRRK